MGHVFDSSFPSFLKDIFAVQTNFFQLLVHHPLYVSYSQKAGVEFCKTSNQKNSQGRLETKTHLLIVNHEHKERIHITIKDKHPGHSKKSKTKFRPKECGELVYRRLYNEAIIPKDQKHMGGGGRVQSRLRQEVKIKLCD